MRILWVKSGGLVPLDTGGKIRSFNLLKELARYHDVTLFTFYRKHTGDAHEELRKFFPRVVNLPLSFPAQRGFREAIEYTANLFSLQPYSLSKYGRREARRELRRLVREETFDVLICDFLFSAPVIPWDLACPKVVFTHNVETQIWRRHFEVTGNPIWKAVAWREYRTMQRAERRYLEKADHILAVSENDRDMFGEFLNPQKITVIPTGVDVDYFRPSGEPENTDAMVFTGSMDWMPNEDAILYFVREILPRIRQDIPKAELWIVGRDPSRRLRDLAANERGVHMTGTVDDIRPYVWKSAVYVVPLRIGGGTRIKIFEAMAMGKAIVSTTVGAEGLPVKNDSNIMLADHAEQFSMQAVQLLRSAAERKRLGQAARELVERNFSWTAVVGQFDKVFAKLVQGIPEVPKETARVGKERQVSAGRQ